MCNWKIILSLSTVAVMISGIVQGSGMEPILFLIFINDLTVYLKQFGVNMKLFAENVKIYAVTADMHEYSTMLTNCSRLLIHLVIGLKHGRLQSLSTSRGFRAQRFYLNLLPVLGFLYHSKDLDEPDKPMTSVFLISQHMKSYKPSKKWSYLRLSLFSVCTKVLSFTGFR